MPSNAAWPHWLEELWWRDVWMKLEATEPATLPPYLGSTLRGAMGHLLRTALCEDGSCHECRRPDSCRYFALFEQNREGAKPFIVLAPPPPGLEEIAMGGPVQMPYRTGAPQQGERIPRLRCEAGWKFEPGGTLQFGLRLLGGASNALPAIVEGVARHGLALGGFRFRLVSARDVATSLLYDWRVAGLPVQMPAARSLRLEEEPARRVRIVFLSPAVFKLDRAPTFAPEEFAARFFEHSISRATKMQHACTGVRPPWVEAPGERAELAGQRTFHYELSRHSFRQEKWLDFDGVVGYVDLAGDLRAMMPWARAAEVLHFGQKAAFGLGKVRVLVME